MGECFRCHKVIDRPGLVSVIEGVDENDKLIVKTFFNADYIIASDTVVTEPREVLFALKHNSSTLFKETQILETEVYLDDVRPKYPGLKITDEEYDAVEIPDFKVSKQIAGVVKVVVREKDVAVQKTGIICPEDYKPTDEVIWGFHK